MAATRKSDYYQNQYDNLLLDTIKGIDEKVDKVQTGLTTVSTLVKTQNRRIGKLENAKDTKDTKSGTIIDNRKLAYMALIALIFFLVIIAGVVGVKLPAVGGV